MKYPIGIQSFDRIRKDGFVYIDKTALVYNLVQMGSIYFLSRPRRFGKSLLVSTLACYFKDGKSFLTDWQSPTLKRLVTISYFPHRL